MCRQRRCALPLCIPYLAPGGVLTSFCLQISARTHIFGSIHDGFETTKQTWCDEDLSSTEVCGVHPFFVKVLSPQSISSDESHVCFSSQLFARVYVCFFFTTFRAYLCGDAHHVIKSFSPAQIISTSVPQCPICPCLVVVEKGRKANDMWGGSNPGHGQSLQDVLFVAGDVERGLGICLR